MVVLLKTVARLALPSDAQLAYLKDRGLLPSIDELALELDDVAVLLPQFADKGWITDEDASDIARLNALLERMSGPEHQELWSEQALQQSPKWKEVRELARQILGQ